MKRILIDAGHGGKDRANKGYSGKYVEADGNLEFSLALQEYLKPYFDVVMVREKDETVALNTRALMSKDCDISISIHSDAFNSPSVGGTTMFVSDKLDNDDLARKIGIAISDSLGISFRGVKKRVSTNGDDYYAMVRIPQQLGVPYVLLVERAFHSNPSEEFKLMNKEFTLKSARAMADVLIEYFNADGGDNMKIEFKDKTTEIDTLFVAEDNRNYIKVNNIYLPVADMIRALGLDFTYTKEDNKVEIL